MPKGKLKGKGEKLKVEAKAPEIAVVAGAQVMKGRVVAAKSEKTVTVLIERARMHPMYKKAFAQTSKYLVHTEQPLKEGDLVEIVKVRPISKRKHWIVRNVVGRDLEAIITEELKEGAEDAISEVLPEKVKVEAQEEEK